ncbi:MAG: RagB/SusD family nutrient uptake outer membrane protein [Prevotella sp.]|jgi:tetratricopeptide (TPR) repeat protein|nr:RagB/SusD family nutrient uptake outer membrane protein [Prevotella sp.]MCH4212369.1 RagB/SusD family nutrient uptake outer membrane protein [Prevotella sp.]MCH4241462.1 RagB/SusD family nutrient uptake outer membrane protein [Prevotella sp.]
MNTNTVKRKLCKFFPLFFIAVLPFWSSCSGYLDNVPKGEKIPTALEDFTEMIANQYQNQREDISQALILMNDRYISPSSLSYYPLWKANYLWDENADRIKLNKSDETTYYNGYGAISTANLILENAPSATNCTDAERAVAIAQARILRAMKYFTLVNYYSHTYNVSTASSDGGVPLITSAEVGASYTQPSVQGIYDFILADINAALPDLPEKSSNILYADKATGNAFAARVYLQMSDYEKALKYAQAALAYNDSLFDWKAFYSKNQGVLAKEGSYQKITSPMDFTFCENYNFCHGSSSNQGNDLNLGVDRAARFEPGDAEFLSRWKKRTVGSETYYTAMTAGYYNRGGMTTTEVYLIEAECLARLGKVNEAMAVLNKVRKARVLDGYFKDLKASSAEEAIRQIRDVKANALILTIVPFCDARRLNMESAYARTLEKTENGVNYTLSPDSHLWTMPFPQGAVDNSGNGKIAQNVNQ